MIETLPIMSLILDPSNARKHSEKNLEAIKGSLAKFGQQKPIIITESNVVVAGNGTLTAARALGWETIQVVRTNLKGSDVTAFAIADNRTAELAAWDDDVLQATLSALDLEGYDMDAMGFTSDELATLMKQFEADVEESESQEDDVDETGAGFESDVKAGDLFQLGHHRILCGDASDPMQVDKLMGLEKADWLYTDPPYGISFKNGKSDFKRKNKTARPTLKNKVYKPLIGDDTDFDASNLLVWFKDAREIFLWGANYYAHSIPQNSGSWTVWDKKTTEDGVAIAENFCTSAFELCWSKKKHHQKIAHILWSGVNGHNKTNDGSSKIHPTQKPVKLHEWFFNQWGKDGDLVVDLYLGSGSTLIACEKTNRRCFGMEIDPYYVDRIISRWESFTGKKAERIEGVE